MIWHCSLFSHHETEVQEIILLTFNSTYDLARTLTKVLKRTSRSDSGVKVPSQSDTFAPLKA